MRFSEALLRAVALLLLASAGGAAPRTTARGDEAYRLPGDVVPSHYAVHVAPRVPNGGVADADSFDGQVKIAAQVVHATDTITLHSADNIKIASITVLSGDDTAHQIKAISLDTEHEFLIIMLSEVLEEELDVNIYIEYTATFPQGMEGFYKSTYKYTNAAGEQEERVLFATQFEPTYARKAFPAFDEPGYKATFQLTIDAPKGFGALSNTPAKEVSTINENQNSYVFLETPKMSVYLVAFLVYEEATYLSTPTDTSRIPITSWAPKDAIEAGQADYSQDQTPKILGVMEEYTGIRFAHENIQKIDEVAIPDFTAGAMENWGLVTYREDTLLLDPEQSTAHDRQYISEVISHELAHQWFGNLVSPQWWDYTWLSEGFARYFQYWVPGQLNPDWRMDEQLQVDIQQAIFAFDALDSALPLSTPVYTPSEIVERFGAMSYNKGSSVMRMVKNILGEENFQEALHLYLQNNDHGSGTPESLFAAFDAYAPTEDMPEGLTMSTVLETWTEQAGFPVLTVNRSPYESVLFVTQKRFLLSTSSRARSNEEYYVQYELQQQNGQSISKLWDGPGMDTKYLVVDTTDNWVLIKSTGYFRVNYWPENWAQLGAALRANAQAVAPPERAQLVDDALNLARAGYLTYDIALDFVRYLTSETDYVPWTAAFSGLSFLDQLLANVDSESLFPAFLLELLDGVYAQLGFADGGAHLDKLLRAQVLARACGAGRSDCLQEAQQRLGVFLSGGASVEPDLRSVVYCYGVKAGDDTEWSALWKVLQTTDNPGERGLLVTALGCSDDVDTLNKYLGYSLDSSLVRQQDAAAVFAAVYANPQGVDPALDFLVSRFDEITQSYGAMRDIGNIVRGIAAQLSSVAQQSEIVTFVEEHPELGESGSIALDSVAANVDWLAVHLDEVLAALRPTQKT